MLLSSQLLISTSSCTQKVVLWIQKLFLATAPLFELKHGSRFIRPGMRSYLGRDHVTEINMTQSTQPLTLIHNKVWNCLSIECSGLWDLESLLLFHLLFGRCNIRTGPVFHRTGSNKWSRTFGRSKVTSAPSISSCEHNCWDRGTGVTV